MATETANFPDQPGMEVVTPSGLTIRAVPEVVDLRTLNQASGDMQIRDRSRFSSDAWVMENASKLDGNRLLPTATQVLAPGCGAGWHHQLRQRSREADHAKRPMLAREAYAVTYYARGGLRHPLKRRMARSHGLVMKQATDI